MGKEGRMKTRQLQNSQLEKNSCCGMFSVCPCTGCSVTIARFFRPGGELCCKDLSKVLRGAVGDQTGHIRIWLLWDFPGEIGHLILSTNKL